MDRKTIIERLQPMTFIDLLQMKYEMNKYGVDKDWVEIIDEVVNGKNWNPEKKTLADQEFDFSK